MTDRTIPRDPTDDYSTAATKAGQEFIREHTSSTTEHVANYSLDRAQRADCSAI